MTLGVAQQRRGVRNPVTGYCSALRAADGRSARERNCSFDVAVGDPVVAPRPLFGGDTPHHADQDRRHSRRRTDGPRHRAGRRPGGLRHDHGEGHAGLARRAQRARSRSSSRRTSRRASSPPPTWARCSSACKWTTHLARPRERRPRSIESIVEELPVKREHFSAPRRHREGRRDLRDQHVDADRRRARRRDRAARQASSACTSSTRCTP